MRGAGMMKEEIKKSSSRAITQSALRSLQIALFFTNGYEKEIRLSYTKIVVDIEVDVSLER